MSFLQFGIIKKLPLQILIKKIKYRLSSLALLNKLFVSGGLTFLFRIGGLGINFLVMLIITNQYGDKVYGSYSLVFTLAQAAGLLFALGFPNALVSHLGLRSMNDPFSQQMFRKGLGILAAITLIPFLLFFFGADYIAEYVFGSKQLSDYILIAAFTIPAMMLHEFVLYFFIATGNFIKFNIFMFLVPNIILLLLLFFITNIPGSYTFLFYTISVVGVLAIECVFALKKYSGSKEKTMSAKAMIKYASPMMFSGLMLYLLNWTDVFLLGAMVSEEEVGYYNLAYRIASLSMLVIASINVVIAPRVAKLYKDGDLKAMHSEVKKSTHIIIALTTPIVLGIILLSDFLLTLFGKSFGNGREALIIISAGFLLNAATGTVDQVLNMTGNQKVLQNITIMGFVLNAVLNVMLIPEYGINGSAMASLITNVVFNFTCAYYIKKKLGFYTFA